MLISVRGVKACSLRELHVEIAAPPATAGDGQQCWCSQLRTQGVGHLLHAVHLPRPILLRPLAQLIHQLLRLHGVIRLLVAQEEMAQLDGLRHMAGARADIQCGDLVRRDRKASADSLELARRARQKAVFAGELVKAQRDARLVIWERSCQYTEIRCLPLGILVIAVYTDAQAQRKLLRLRVVDVHREPPRRTPVCVAHPAAQAGQQYTAAALGHPDR